MTCCTGTDLLALATFAFGDATSRSASILYDVPEPSFADQTGRLVMPRVRDGSKSAC